MRRLIVLGLLALLPVARNAEAWSGYVVIRGQLVTGELWTTPIPYMRVQVWESDAGQDDYLSDAITDENGYFLWSGYVDDQQGLTNPELYLKARFSGPRLVLSHNPLDVYGDPQIYRFGSIMHPQDHVGPSGTSSIELGAIGIGGGAAEDAYVWNFTAEVLDRVHYRYHVGIYLSAMIPYVSNPCSSIPGVLSLGYVDVMPEHLQSIITRCLLDRVGALSGTPAPPGGGFDTVTNEGYAWDEGILAFVEAALNNNPYAPGGLEAVPAAASADAPRIAANVAASLYDLYDAHEDGSPPARDEYQGTLEQIMNVLYNRPVHSLAEFWEGWKNDYNPRHYPLLALLTNGVNYNTPPVWSQIPPFWLQPGTPYTYDLALKVADAETPDNLLTYTVTGQGYGRHNHPQPITINVSGSQVTVTISSSEPDGYGYAFLSATANDWITTSTLPHFKAIWGNEGDDTQEIDRASRAGAVPLQFGFQGERVLSTTARFALALPIRSAGSVTVFDLQGRLVRTLRDGEQPAGEHVIEWNGASDSGVRVQPGVYFVAARYSAGHATLRTSVIR